MDKVYNRFQTKTALKPNPMGRHIYLYTHKTTWFKFWLARKRKNNFSFSYRLKQHEVEDQKSEQLLYRFVMLIQLNIQL